jgi:hypothetical protein
MDDLGSGEISSITIGTMNPENSAKFVGAWQN